MQKQNKAEYEIMRRELESVKNCITTYVGFFFVALAAATGFWGHLYATEATNANDQGAIGLTSLALSLLTVAMLFILIYKFESHNRYAGYCHLLGDEQWDATKPPETDVMIWELCIDMLRVAGSRVTPDVYSSYAAAMDASRSPCGSQPEFWTSFWHTVQRLVRKRVSSSWGFPKPLVSIFLVAVWGCIVLAGATLLPPLVHDMVSVETWSGFVGALGRNWSGLVFLFVLLVQVLLGRLLVIRYETLLEGNRTVLCFSRRFLPIRRALLARDADRKPSWPTIESGSGASPHTKTSVA